MIAPDDRGFLALRGAVSAGAGLALEAYKDKCVRRRIAVRMRACGVHTYAEYQALLERTPGELERLADALTINVTRFFRNSETWDAVRGVVLPRLGLSGRGPVRVWSAGCASGEEPYSIALLLAEELERAGRGAEPADLEVHATDVDRTSLERTRDGWYPAAALANVPARFVQRHFEARGGGYQVRSTLRRLVRVSRRDLARDPPPAGDFDLICCRNVVIYFDRPLQERLFVTFSEALRPGGHLVLGKVETLVGPARDRLVLVDPRERIYRRPV